MTRVTRGGECGHCLHRLGSADSEFYGDETKGAVVRREAFMSFALGMKTIVVATDLGSQSEAALEYARKLAGGYGARIVLAHGIDPLDYASLDGVPGRVLKGLTEEARAALDLMAGELLREGIPSHSEIRQGAVAKMLVDVARQYEAGMIVIGTKGSQGAGPVLVGAVAEQLVRLAPCPVLAVSADWNAGPFRPTPGGPVLLAMERNEATQAAVATAYSLAETFQRTLLVLHATPPGRGRGVPESLRHHPGRVRRPGGRALSGALHRQGRQPGRRHRGSHRAASSQHFGGRGQAGQRYAGAAWHRLCPAGAFAGSHIVRSAGAGVLRAGAGGFHIR